MFYVPPNLDKNPNLRSDIHVLGSLSLLSTKTPVFSAVKTSLIQNHVIASILANRDVLCIGPPRSGKTSAALLAALQLAKDEGVRTVFAAGDARGAEAVLRSLRAEVGLVFDARDALLITAEDPARIDAAGKLVVVDNAERCDANGVVEDLHRRRAARVVLVCDERVAVPRLLGDGRAKTIEIRALGDGKAAEGRKGDRARKWERGGGGGGDAPRRAGAGAERAGQRPRRAQERRQHVFVPQQRVRDEFPGVLRGASLKKTWRGAGGEAADAVAIYGGLRHTQNAIEAVLRGMGVKYAIVDKKAKERDGANVFVVPEGTRKPANRHFDLVVNYVFPETFEEYAARAESAARVVSFIGDIDEGFKRKLARLVADDGQQVPALLSVCDSAIDEFDAFHVEPDREDASDTDLWL